MDIIYGYLGLVILQLAGYILSRPSAYTCVTYIYGHQHTHEQVTVDSWLNTAQATVIDRIVRYLSLVEYCAVSLVGYCAG
jgi:hypothetical protein